MATRSPPSSTTCKIGGSRSSPRACPARENAEAGSHRPLSLRNLALLLHTPPEVLSTLATLRYPWTGSSRGVLWARELTYIRFCLRRWQEGTNLYLYRLLGLAPYPPRRRLMPPMTTNVATQMARYERTREIRESSMTSRSTRKATTQPDQFSRPAQPGAAQAHTISTRR